ncbi:DNA polymerase III, delta subunit [Parvibaculum lavamentivorans DS-1]|uniref:DNA-directed DNA polymerase n=1 Tax=Parvibaculum lavamentivorans (strain DS-1 / DSM 13023 / NCIMB 13966) TaxID=402881 RepID=A7HSL5_PARL1|nr:DNA polymerase III subunit delta [Parvibaculum lavamentivorans]ABS62898.1 DNA polymerase III, delta subunit [Parvibaculum lavamentivorans DS-1]
MKISPREADRFATKPDPKVVAVLAYGPDAGLVRERIKMLARTVVDDLADPFRVAELSDTDLKQDPARLSDEAAAIAMLGGRRVVRVRGAADATAKIFESFLENPAGDALVLVEAGELGPRSSLRLLFEGAANAAAIACYADDAGVLENVIRTRLANEGLVPEPAALEYLRDHLGSDRGVTQNELEKLILYAGPGKQGEKRAVTLDDARASVGDNAGTSLDDVIDAAMGGDLDGLDVALARARAAETNAIAILNALSRHLMQLHLATARIETGSDVEGAIRSFRPPVHFSRKNAVQRQMKLWNRKRLDRALALALEAEGQCKSSGQPDVAICGQTLLRIAQGARAARR